MHASVNSVITGSDNDVPCGRNQEIQTACCDETLCPGADDMYITNLDGALR